MTQYIKQLEQRSRRLVALRAEVANLEEEMRTAGEALALTRMTKVRRPTPKTGMTHAVLEVVNQAPQGGFSVKEIQGRLPSHLTNQESNPYVVNQVLSGLTKRGKVRRIQRGVYAAPPLLTQAL